MTRLLQAQGTRARMKVLSSLSSSFLMRRHGATGDYSVQSVLTNVNCKSTANASAELSAPTPTITLHTPQPRRLDPHPYAPTLTASIFSIELHTIEYYRLPIPDRRLLEGLNLFRKIHTVVWGWRKNVGITAVYFRGGFGRMGLGTVVGCWLVRVGVA